jgi:transcription termination factor NusB
MIYKAMALVCFMTTATDHKCETRFYKNTFDDLHSCETALIRWRLYELTDEEKIVLNDCVLSNNK